MGPSSGCIILDFPTALLPESFIALRQPLETSWVEERGPERATKAEHPGIPRSAVRQFINQTGVDVTSLIRQRTALLSSTGWRDRSESIAGLWMPVLDVRGFGLNTYSLPDYIEAATFNFYGVWDIFGTGSVKESSQFRDSGK